MITVENLGKIFGSPGGPVAAVNQIGFSVKDGAFFTLLGPSGCGKTTTLRCLAGLEQPNTGEIVLGDEVVFSSTRRTFVPTHLRPIGMVFQSYAIWPHMTVFQNVAYPLTVRKMPAKEIRRRVAEALDLVGLGHLADRSAPRLSGGQQQRVALARAVVARPKVLLLDEPLSNLDAKLRIQMRTELKELQKNLGVTSVYVTHDQQEAMAMSDAVAVMNEGRIVQTGSPEQIYLNPADRFTASFLGAANFLEGRFAGRRAGQTIQVETAVGPVWVQTNQSAGSGEMTLSIRPEMIALSSSPPVKDEGLNVFEARVGRVQFLGDTVEYRLHVGEMELQARGNPFRRFTTGETVFASVSSQGCTAIPKEPERPKPWAVEPSDQQAEVN